MVSSSATDEILSDRSSALLPSGATTSQVPARSVATPSSASGFSERRRCEKRLAAAAANSWRRGL